MELAPETHVDMADWGQVQAVPRFDVLVHLAARTSIPESQAAPRDTLHVNVMGTLNALEACRRHSAKMIFASTYVYGRPHYLPIREDHPVEALNPYTESKLIGERLCACYHRDFGLRCTVLRAFNIYGPGQDSGFLLPTIVAQARRGSIELQDGTPRRDFVFIDDVVDAYLRAIEFDSDGYGLYNIGSGRSHSVSEVAEMIRLLVNPACGITFSGKTRPGEIADTVADTARAEAHLGWRATVSLDQGLRITVGDTPADS